MALLCSERLYREHADRKAKHVLGYGWLWAVCCQCDMGKLP